MNIKLVDESDIKKTEKKRFPVDLIDKDEIVIKEENAGKKEILKLPEANGMTFISKENIVECERSARLGVTDNCALCQAMNSELFKKCPNKWK